MRATATAMAFVLAASSPALADLRADDVWHGWGAALAQAGALQTGTVMRDGDMLTLRNPGAMFDLPQGWGRISWALDVLTMAEDGAGGVTLSIPRGAVLDVSATLPLPGRNPGIRLSAEITADGLEWRYSGTPDDMRGELTAERIIIEATRLEGMGQVDLPFELTAGFVVAEDVSRTTQITGGDTPRLSNETRIAHLVSDLSAEGADGRIWRSAEYHALAHGFEITLPDAPLATPALTPFLRAGARIAMHGAAGEASIRTTLRDEGETLRDDQQQLTDGHWSLGLTRRNGLELAFGNNGFGMSRHGEDVLRMNAATLNLRIPLVARKPVQEARFGLRLNGLTLNDPWRERIGLPEGAPSDPANIDLALRADMILSDDLTAPDWLRDHAARGVWPLELLRLELESLTAGWAGAEVTGSGWLVWPEGAVPGPDMPDAEGEAVIEAAGLHALLARVVQGGALSPGMIMTLRGALAFFGAPIGPDRVEMHLGYGPEGFAVNGMAVPF